MPTEDVYLTGKLSFVYCVQPDQKYNKWSARIHPDNESLEKIRKLQSEGVKNVLSMDDDGWNVSFSRPTERLNRTTGARKGFDPPLVLDGSKPLPSGGFEPWDGRRIGHGSDGVMKLEVYSHRVPGSTKMAKAARLAAVRVDNLVPFEPKKDFSDIEKKQAEGMDQQPKQLW